MSDIPRQCSVCKVIKTENDFSNQKIKRKSGSIYVYKRKQCKACRVIETRAWAKANPVQANKHRKKIKLKYRYGLCYDEYKKQLELQDNKCPICKVSFAELSINNVHLDHCHTTGNIRGILCFKCNRGLGFFDDDTERMKLAATYLEQGGTWSRSVVAENKADRAKRLVIAR